MAWTKTKTAIVVGAGLLLAAITIMVIYARRPYPWQVKNEWGYADGDILDQVSPQVKIVPTIFPPSDGYSGRNGKMLGMGQSINTLLSAAYDASKYRTVFATKPSEDRYDFIANLSEGNQEALRREIERQFNLTAKTEKRKTDVLLLTVKNRNAQGLRPSANNSSGTNVNNGAGYYRGTNVLLRYLAGFLEYYFEIPVIDRTGLVGRFDISIRWQARDWEHRNPDALKKVLLEELGLELVLGREEIEMLVVENAH